ncbi:hypothetical protein EMPS_07742 [Entomortierella parvispora]|uniref:Nuclear segregation protein BFR1 n=1 Tax=Entomortierella parvispora TaxID=205924 RepID=A0A9P3LYM7_9FUNG|nr:hypothetical protein EMPS_07742 [Entomortierella parvispora]
MSILDTAAPVSPTATSVNTGAKKQQRIYVKKPNPEDKKRALNEIEVRIAVLRPQLDAVRDAIASIGDKKEADARAPLRKKLAELRDLQTTQKKSKKVKLDELSTLNASLKKKIANLKALQDKLPLKTMAAVESQIDALEKQIQAGKLKLVEEKRLLSEISLLTRSKKSVETAQKMQTQIDEDKKAIASLKTALDDPATKALSDEYSTIQAQLDEMTRSKDEVWKKRNDLYGERTRLQKALETEFQLKKSVNDDYFAALREHSKFIQEEQDRKRDEIKARKQQELEEKLLARARDEREDAEIPAFQEEITICDNVYKYLLQFSNDPKRSMETSQANASTEAHSSTVRPVDTTTNVPRGVMLTKKAEKVEDVFFVGGKTGKKVKGPKEKKSEVSTLKFPLAILEQLLELKIVVPTSASDLRKTLDSLEEKSKDLKSRQAEATAENKRKAEERIATLTLTDVDQIEAAVETTQILPEIEATA